MNLIALLLNTERKNQEIIQEPKWRLVQIVDEHLLDP